MFVCVLFCIFILDCIRPPVLHKYIKISPTDDDDDSTIAEERDRERERENRNNDGIKNDMERVCMQAIYWLKNEERQKAI